MDPYRRYIAILVVAVLVPLASLLGVSLTIGDYSLCGGAVVRRGLAWQLETGGTLHVPTYAGWYYKAQLLERRGGAAEVVALGSSTVFTLGSAAFPEGTAFLNQSGTSNPIFKQVGQARDLLARFPRVRVVLLTMDWYLGWLYLDGPMEFTPPQDVHDFGFKGALRQAIGLPRTRLLAEAVGRSLRQLVRDPGGVPRYLIVGEYQAPGGTRAFDTDFQYGGVGHGHAPDGAHNFAAFPRLDGATDLAATRREKQAAGHFAALLAAGGRIAAPYLQAFRALHEELRARGGSLVLLVPPLVPGYHREIARDPALGAALGALEGQLAALGRETGMRVLAASASEDFGCTAADFVDLYHITGPGYVRIFRKLWPSGGP